VIVEIAIDDAVLQHPAEGERQPAGRPGEAAAHRVIGGEHQQRAKDKHDEAVTEPRERNALVADQTPNSGGEQHRNQDG
jgi:hypothetical protein